MFVAAAIVIGALLLDNGAAADLKSAEPWLRVGYYALAILLAVTYLIVDRVKGDR